MYRHMHMTSPSAQTAMRISLRAKRLKYSSAGENASMTEVKNAPGLPSLLRKKIGSITSTVPATAYSRREV